MSMNTTSNTASSTAFNSRVMHTTLHRIILFLTMLTILSGCTETPEDEVHPGHDEHSDHDDESSEVTMTPEAIATAGILTAPVTRESGRERILLPAVVALQEDGVARVGTVVPGRIARLAVSEGTYVKRGSLIAEIESPEIGKVRAGYLEAVARERSAKLAFERQKRLAAQNIGAERDLEEAEAAYESAVAARREEGAHLRLYGINPEKARTSLSNRIRVTAPIAGVVAKRSVTLGEYVESSDDIVTLVNISTVRIDAQATAEQASRLAVGALGFAPLPDGRTTSGRITWIAPTLDPDSRTATVRFTLSNPNGVLRPGSFLTASYETNSSRSTIVIPTSALDRVEGKLYVWRLEEPGHFQRIELTGVEEQGERVYVESGLSEGDQVVVEGVFYLRSALDAGELEEHDH